MLHIIPLCFLRQDHEEESLSMAIKNETNIGIWSVGAYLPSNIRANDWWTDDIVASWSNRQAWDESREQRALADAPTEGAVSTLKAMKEHAGDPFHGAKERRVLSVDMTAGDMENAAALDAIEKAGIDRGEIDMLLSFSAIGDRPGPGCPTTEGGLPGRRL